MVKKLPVMIHIFFKANAYFSYTGFAVWRMLKILQVG